MKRFPEVRDIRLVADCPFAHTEPFDALTHFTMGKENGRVYMNHKDSRIICFKNMDHIMIGDEPSELFWHEYAHIISEPEYDEDLGHGEKFKKAVLRLNRPWLYSPTIDPAWLEKPPTLEAWLSYGI